MENSIAHPQKIQNRINMRVCLCAKLFQLCPNLFDPMNCNPPGSSVHGILQARILSGLPCPPPEDLPHPGIKPASLMSPALADGVFTTSATWEAPKNYHVIQQSHFWVYIPKN